MHLFPQKVIPFQAQDTESILKKYSKIKQGTVTLTKGYFQ